MRWDPYVLADDHEFELFWRTHLATRNRHVLFVLGRGFDPRALAALQRIVDFGAKPRACPLNCVSGVIVQWALCPRRV